MTLPVQDFIVQQLLEFDPTFDVGGGVATTSLLIEPLSVILQPIINELSAVQRNQSILQILEQADPDAFPEDIVDGLASNVFIERKLGETASTTQRVRFFEAQDFSSPQGILVFRGPGGQRFTNTSAVSITQAEMSLNVEGGLVYVDMPIFALDAGTAFNVSAGAITNMEAEPAGVANTTNLFDVIDGRDRETNTELIDRIKIAVTVRALVTGRGIIVTLTENFTTIVEIQPIGFGDPEMMRDIVFNVHIGGNVDVYVRTSTLSTDSDDITAVEIDVTRQVTASTVLATFVEGTAFDLLRRSIDRTVNVPVVTSIDGGTSYDEGAFDDYTIDDVLGTITRVSGSAIVHLTGSGATFSSNKTLFDTGAFGGVKPGMILTITPPAGQAGTFTVRTKISSDEIEIYGAFPGIGLQATGVLTLTGLPLDTQTVVIDGKTYMFQTVLTDFDGNVQIGVTPDASLNNLINAINLGPNGGAYAPTLMTEHTTVGAAAGVGDTMIATADAPGLAGNSIATAETLTNGAWDGSSLSGGTGDAPGTGDWLIDDNLSITFDHNPISIDIIEAARSAARVPFTITNVPLMKTVQIAVLDPISGEPTGELLDKIGGFGSGGFGEGGFGEGGGADFSLVVTDPTLRFSQKEDNFLSFDLEFLGFSLRVNYIYAAAIEAIQTFVEDDQNRTEAADLLVRHFGPTFVDTGLDIEYQIPAATEPTAVTVAEMTTLVEEFIDDIDGGDDLEASDLIDLFYDNGASRVDLDTVLDLQAILHHHDGSTELVPMSDQGVMAIPNETIPDPSNKPVSPRIARFIANTIVLERTVA